jgi:hypothetical protein
MNPARFANIGPFSTSSTRSLLFSLAVAFASGIALPIRADPDAPRLTPQLLPRENLFQGEARKRAFAEVARMKKIQAKYVDVIRAQPGVVGMGITADRQTRQLKFLVLLDLDVPVPALPGTIEEIPVTLLRVPRPEPTDGGPGCQPCHNDILPLPVEMGNSGRTGFIPAPGGCFAGRGTLGFKACDWWDDVIVYATSAHLSTSTNFDCAGTAGPGAPTFHPAPFDAPTNCVPTDIIGAVAKERPPICGTTNHIDAASVISDSSQTQQSIRDIGLPNPYPKEAMLWDLVQKSGRTTGYTTGGVAGVGISITVLGSAYCPCGAADMIDQILIVPAVPGVDWVVSGDSGSAVLDFNVEGGPAIMGLNMAGAKDPVTGVWLYGTANPIYDVLAQLDLSLNIFDCTLPCVATLTAKETADPRPLIRASLDLRDYIFSQSERGQTYIQYYYRITAELSRLVLNRPALFVHTASVFEQLQPVIQTMAAGRPVTVTREQLRTVDQLFERFAEASSDPLVDEAIALFRRDLRDPEVHREFKVRLEP